MATPAGLVVILGILLALASDLIFPSTNYWVVIFVGSIVVAVGILYSDDRANLKQTRDLEDARKTKRLEVLERLLTYERTKNHGKENSG